MPVMYNDLPEIITFLLVWRRLLVYPTGTSKRFLLMYKASQLCDVPGWVFTCAAERRDVFAPVASWSKSGYKGASDALSELGML